MKKLKGIVLVVILLLASIMMPFDVYAAVESTIAPTFSSSSSEWNGHLHVTNFTEGSNNQASSSLHFTFDDDYYGMVYFDGYGPSNQLIANYAVVFIAAGSGEYRYSYYQNGVINITQVTIQSVSVVKPGSSVDLSQIVTLLTAIESDTTAIDNVLDTTLSQIRLVLAELIISNDYLELISQYRQWNFPIESYNFISYWFSKDRQLIDYYDVNNYYTFPRFKMNANDYIIDQYYVNAASSGNTYVDVVLLIQHTGNTIQAFTSNMTLQGYTNLNYFVDDVYGYSYLRKYTFITTSSGNKYIRYPREAWVTPIFIGYSSNQIYRVTTDFAIRFGLNNQLLNDIHIIALGTNQSNSAASDLETSNEQMADDMDDLATIESGYNQQFNNQLQQIDFTSPLQNNAGILPAANFVITIFNGLVNNPFSVLIMIVSILLIGKKVIGG